MQKLLDKIIEKYTKFHEAEQMVEAGDVLALLKELKQSMQEHSNDEYTIEQAEEDMKKCIGIDKYTTGDLPPQTNPPQKETVEIKKKEKCEHTFRPNSFGEILCMGCGKPQPTE